MRFQLLSLLIAAGLAMAAGASAQETVTAQNSNYLRYPNGNKASFELLDEAIRQDTRLYPPADTYARLFMVEMFTDEALRNLTRSWTRMKAQL
jgi:putrescine transport system substrate-binding protein